MARGTILLLLLASFAFSADPKAGKENDDPLPLGAIKRFGTRKFRLNEGTERVALRPDGKAYAEWTFSELRIYDITGKQLLKASMTPVGAPSTPRWSSDSKQLMLPWINGVMICNTATGKVEESFTIGDSINSNETLDVLATTPDLKAIVLQQTSKEKNRTVLVWSPGNSPRPLPGADTNTRYYAAITRDGRRLALSPFLIFETQKLTEDQQEAYRKRIRSIDLYDPLTQESLGTQELPFKGMMTPGVFQFLPDDETILVHGHDERLFTYNIKNRAEVRELEKKQIDSQRSVWRAKVSNEGKQIVSFSNQELKTWDVATGKLIGTMTVRASFLDVHFLDAVVPTAGPPVSLLRDHARVRILPIVGEKSPVSIPKEHMSSIAALGVGKDGRLTSVGNDGLVIRWDSTGKAANVMSFEGPEWAKLRWGWVQGGAAVALSPDLTKLATSVGVVTITGAQPTLAFKLKDVTAADMNTRKNEYSRITWRFVWSADGKRLLGFWDRDGAKVMSHGLVVYDDTGKLIYEEKIDDGEGRPEFVADLSEDGKKVVGLASVTKSGKTVSTLTVWDVSQGKPIANRVWDNNSDSWRAFVKFTGDAQGVFTNIGKESYRIPLNKFDTETTLKIDLRGITITYTRDRKGFIDGEYLRDEATGQIIADIRPVNADRRSFDYQTRTTRVAFSHDGNSMYLGQSDGTILQYAIKRK